MKQKTARAWPVRWRSAYPLAGCHFSTPDTVGTIGRRDDQLGPVPCWPQFDAYQQAAQYAGEDQDPSSVKSFLKATITPDGGEAVTVSDYVAQTTLEELRAAMWRWRDRFAELGAELGPRLHLSGRQLHRPADRELRRPVCRQRHRRGDHPQLRNTTWPSRPPWSTCSTARRARPPCTDEELTDHLQNQMLYIRYTTVPPVRSVHLRLCGRGPDRPDAWTWPKQAAADSTPDTFDQVVADALPGIYAVLGTEITAEEAADQLNSSFISLSEMEGSFSDEDTQTLTGLAFGQSAAVQLRRPPPCLIAMRMDPPRDHDPRHPARGTILSDMGTSLCGGGHGRRRRGPLGRPGPERHEQAPGLQDQDEPVMRL